MLILLFVLVISTDISVITITYKMNLSTSNLLARTTMKNAAKCEISYELQNLVNHSVFEHNFYLHNIVKRYADLSFRYLVYHKTKFVAIHEFSVGEYIYCTLIWSILCWEFSNFIVSVRNIHTSLYQNFNKCWNIVLEHATVVVRVQSCLLQIGNFVQVIDDILQKYWKLDYISDFPFVCCTQLHVREPAKFKHITRQWNINKIGLSK